MTKYRSIIKLLLPFVILFIVHSNVFAISPETELLLELLEKKGIVTNDEARALKEAVESRKKQKVEKEAIVSQRAKKLEDKIEKIEKVAELMDKVSFSGLIEVEGFASDRSDTDNHFSKRDSSDVTLATVELGIDAQINEWTSGHILLLWEEDDTEPLDVDEGTITIGNIEKTPFYFTGGKMYVPFGVFETNMIQDPLTLELGETRESAGQIGFEYNGFYGSFYAFNGDVGEKEDNERLESYGVNIGYAFDNDEMSIDIGFDVINNITDSDVLTEALNDYSGSDSTSDYVGGFSAHLLTAIGPFMAIGEYVGATEEYSAGELSDKSIRPESWNIELAYTHKIMRKELTFAVGYQGTKDCMGLLPEDRYMTSIGVEIFKNTALTFEYLHDENYSRSEGGIGGDANVVTGQLAVKF